MSLEVIATIIAKTSNCQIEDIKPESRLADLGLSSLDTLTILFELEEAFDIEIPNEVIPSIVTVNDMLEKLENRHH